MIFSAHRATAFSGRAGPLSCPTDQQRLKILRGFADVVLVGADTARAVALLRAHGMHRILCEGGSTVLDELVDADAIVEICVTLAPKLAASRPVGHRLRPSLLPVPVALRLDHALVYDDYLFLKYRR
jgi:riboflavin biosynthesis pyrimidine reductase